MLEPNINKAGQETYAMFYFIFTLPKLFFNCLTLTSIFYVLVKEMENVEGKEIRD